MRSLVRIGAAVAACLALAGCNSLPDASFHGDPRPSRLEVETWGDLWVGKQGTIIVYCRTRYAEGTPRFLWTLVSRPAGSAATIASPTAGTLSFVADVVGTYGVRLDVTDDTQTVTTFVSTLSSDLAPVVSAGADREVSRAVPVQLTGSASDPDHDPLTYLWTFVRVPDASAAATLSGETTLAPTFVGDVYGTYVLRLTASDGERATSDDVTLSIVNHAPVANAGKDLEANAGDTLALSAAASTDREQEPLSCAWTLVSAPTGSAAALSDAASCAPTIAFDEEGVYALSLVVSDGTSASAPDALQVTVHRKVWRLGLSIADAEYARPLDRIVAVGSAPDRLYSLDPVAWTLESVDLGHAPLSVSVSPDGTHAAVGHDGWVSYVRLSPAPLEVETVFATTATGYDVVLGGNGWIYAFGTPSLHIACIEVATGAETPSTNGTVGSSRARLHPSGRKLYAPKFTNWLLRIDLLAGVADVPWSPASVPVGEDLWMAEDGARIFGKSGNVLHASDDPAVDMTVAGALEGLGSVRWLDHSSARGLVVAVPNAVTAPWVVHDDELRLFDAATLAHLETVPLPRVGVGGAGYASHGSFAFFSADGTRRFVLGFVDPAAGLADPAVLVAY